MFYWSLDAKTVKEDTNVVSAETNIVDEGTSSIGIIIDTAETQEENEDTKKKNEKKIKHKKKLRAAIIKGNRSKVESILKKDEGLATEAISKDGSTVLHTAVGTGHNEMLESFLTNIDKEHVLNKRDSDGSTALHIAAIVGNKHAAELLVKTNSELLRKKDIHDKEPLHKAYEHMHLDTIGCLLKAVNDDGKPDDEIGVNFLVNAISAKRYTVHKIRKWMELSALGFLCFLLLIFLELYYFILKVGKKWTDYVIIFLKVVLHSVAPIKQIENKKKVWGEAKKVLELVCDEIDKLDYTGSHHPHYTRPILEAACQNAYKVVDEILYRSPDVIQSTDANGYDIIQLAIIHRSENIYNLIYDIGERKNLYRTIEDSSKNNILHLAGKLAPSSVLNKRTGAALQLQWELQWREEVKKHVFPTYITKENIFKETPNMIFTREHSNLLKEGEQWMKTTVESCSITAALITTIVFAAAITVPGGSNQEKGTPLFEKKSAFIVFAIADAISLFASSTALLVFLSILTARFAEKDFLVSLPRRLFIGLFSLLLSTTAMMVAFSATLFLVFCDEKLWMLAPLCGLAFIPIAFFVALQFPLMVDLFRSTYLRIFGKQIKTILRRFNPDDIRLHFGK
ncbi:putative ankyrin repeat-containing domain, PGG domain, ankyrin repeat-containing domain superfamily [Helianthus debilis subsp. tardiflorus]